MCLTNTPSSSTPIACETALDRRHPSDHHSCVGSFSRSCDAAANDAANGTHPPLLARVHAHTHTTSRHRRNTHESSPVHLTSTAERSLIVPRRCIALPSRCRFPTAPLPAHCRPPPVPPPLCHHNMADTHMEQRTSLAVDPSAASAVALASPSSLPRLAAMDAAAAAAPTAAAAPAALALAAELHKVQRDPHQQQDDQPQYLERQRSRDGRDNSEKHSTAVRSHPIATSQEAILELRPFYDVGLQLQPHATLSSASSMLDKSTNIGFVANSAPTSMPTIAAAAPPLPPAAAAHDVTALSSVGLGSPPVQSSYEHDDDEKSVSSPVKKSQSEKLTESMRLFFTADRRTPPALQPPSSSSVAASSEAAIASHLPKLDVVCHCLVVEESKLRTIPAALALVAAVAGGGERSVLRAHAASLLAPYGVHASDICVAFTTVANNDRRLHFNFVSLSALAVALLCPFLARCGSIAAASVWSGASVPCGPSRDKLPELVQLSFEPTTPLDRGEVDRLAERLVSQAAIEHASTWVTSSSYSHQGRKVKKVTVNILPRGILAPAMEAHMNRLHGLMEVSGVAVRVSAPNMPSLQRCAQCNILGHHTSVCPQYRGLGVRLLFSSPVPFMVAQQFAQATHAKVAYLGSSIDESQPSRRVTLVFDGGCHAANVACPRAVPTPPQGVAVSRSHR